MGSGGRGGRGVVWGCTGSGWSSGGRQRGVWCGGGIASGSVLGPLLFVIVMEVISRELRAGLPLELLYAGGLVFVAESGEGLRDRMVEWKSGFEARGLKMNAGEARMMFSCGMKDEVGRWVALWCV